jgi:hypothetical protein
VKKFLFLFFMMVGSVYADTTGNLIGGTWNNVATGTHPNNCCTGGPGPLYDPATGIIHFSYGLTAVHQVIAINQALSGSGIQINGWNWGYDLRNMNGTGAGQNGTDTINVTSFMTNSAGQIVQRSDQYFNTQFDWIRFTGTEVLYSPLSLENSGSLGIQFVSGDAGFWAGYYGPQVRNVTLSANYSSVPVDPCTNNPLHSPSCPGYQQAYHDQQCSINPLYATSCPGYQSAYYTQQCSINPLYDSGCPGYAQAYYNQQCTANPLYDSTCPGYQQAYFDQQCSLDPLYNNQCPGYQQAYFDQQCTANPLYNNSCPGYAAAYFNQQCGIDPLYNESCVGYQAAYYSLQCSINTLYDSGCPGYAQAYFDQQCSLNGLYDRSCPNYAQAYATQQLLNQQNNSSSTQTVVAQKTSEPSVQVSSKGEVSTEVQLVADPTVNEVLRDSTKKEVKSSSPAAEVAPIATRPQSAPVSQPAQKAEQKQEQKKTDNEIVKIEKKSDSKDSKSNREKVKEAATEKAKELANEMSNAATIEAQTASQGLVLGLMNYNPGFSAYANAIIPDTGAVDMARQYNKPTVDNRRALRALSGASDRLHQQMVDEQYR